MSDQINDRGLTEAESEILQRLVFKFMVCDSSQITLDDLVTVKTLLEKGESRLDRLLTSKRDDR